MTDKEITEILEKLNNQEKVLNNTILDYSKLNSLDIVDLLLNMIKDNSDIIEELYLNLN